MLDRMLERFKARGPVRARGKQRTDSTHVLAAVHDLHLLELAAEALRATLDDLAAAAPDWLRGVVQPAWFERYGRRSEGYRLPKGQEKRGALALEIGADGFVLLDAIVKRFHGVMSAKLTGDGPTAPAAAREPMLQPLRDVWRVHYARDDGPLRWRSVAELPPVAERMQPPYDPQAQPAGIGPARPHAARHPRAASDAAAEQSGATDHLDV